MWETRVRSLGQEGPLEKEIATTPVLLVGKSHGWRSMVGYRPWDYKESDMIEWQHDTFSLQRFSGPWICKTGTWRVRQGKSSIFITTFFPRTVWYSNYESQTMCYWIRENWFCFLPSLISFMLFQILIHTIVPQASLVAQLIKHLPAMQETWVQSLGWEDTLKKGKATYSSILG